MAPPFHPNHQALVTDERFPTPRDDARRLAARAGEMARRGAVREALAAYDLALALLEGEPGSPEVMELLRSRRVLLRQLQGERARHGGAS